MQFRLDLTRGSSYQSRIGLIVDEIHTISSLIQAEQHASRNAFSQQINAQSGLLTDILQGQHSLQRLLELHSTTSTSQAPPRHQEIPRRCEISTTIVRIAAHTLSTKSWCKPSCTCVCHIIRTIRFPKLLSEVTGTLFIGYSGSPLWTKSGCTAADCLASSVSQVCIQYLFPSWLLSRAISTALLINTYRNINASLIVRRIVPNSAEVIRLGMAEDIDGMRRLFSLGLASPNDSNYNGEGVLWVR